MQRGVMAFGKELYCPRMAAATPIATKVRNKFHVSLKPLFPWILGNVGDRCPADDDSVKRQPSWLRQRILSMAVRR